MSHCKKIKTKHTNFYVGVFCFYLCLKRACANSNTNAYVSADARYRHRQAICIRRIISVV